MPTLRELMDASAEDAIQRGGGLSAQANYDTSQLGRELSDLNRALQQNALSDLLRSLDPIAEIARNFAYQRRGAGDLAGATEWEELADQTHVHVAGIVAHPDYKPPCGYP